MTISIIGLGWLGKPLALHLIKKGHVIKGTTTTQIKIEELTKSGIKAYPFKLGDKLPDEILNCHVIIITIPPRGSNYIDGLKPISNSIKPNTQVIYVSSSSVYPNSNREVFEDQAEDIVSQHSRISLLQAEQVFIRNKATCLRFAGLFGQDRHPGRFLAGKKNVSGANNPVNLIHQEDCIGLIESIIENKIVAESINGCSDIHPSKKEFYTKASELLSLEPPTFSIDNDPFKIISNQKSKDLLNYEYKYPDPLKALELI